MKRCPDCQRALPVEAFHLRYRKESATVRRSYCRECESKRNGAWTKAHPESQRAWRERNAERVKFGQQARNMVAYAIKRGRLARPAACEFCGRTDKPIEAAHWDYSQPLTVRWLCVPCHRQWDRDDPKTLRYVESKAAA